MTVPSEVTKAGPYSGNGVTVQFDYDMVIQAVTSDGDTTYTLKVIQTDSDGVETELTQGTDYTVTNSDAGGYITCTTAPTSDDTITILADYEITQLVNITNQAAIYPSLIENIADKLTMICNQQQEILDRAFIAPSSETGVTYEAPSIVDRANKAAIWDSSGNFTASTDDYEDQAADAAASAAAAAASEAAAESSATTAAAYEASAGAYASEVTAAVEAVAFKYTFESETTAPPSSGSIRFNNADASLATEIYISSETQLGIDIGELIAIWGDSTNTVKGTINIVSSTAQTICSFSISSATVNNTTYFTIAGSCVSETGTFVDGDDVYVAQTRAGDATPFAATDVPFTPYLAVTADDVQEAIEQVQDEVVSLQTDKLDSADYTASDVLSKILTVDGSGSGLDADTLDGVDSTGFAQVYTGTDPNNIDYPIGHPLVVSSTTIPSRNSVVTVYYSNLSSAQFSLTSGTQLNGTWHATSTVASADLVFVQRVE